MVVVVVCVLVTQLCLTLCDPMDCSPPGSSVHEDSPGKNTGESCHFLLQGIFLTIPSNVQSPKTESGESRTYVLKSELKFAFVS